jgi:hypothetical protein
VVGYIQQLGEGCFENSFRLLLTDELNPFLFIYFDGFVQNGLPFSGLPVLCCKFFTAKQCIETFSIEL